MFLEDFNKVFGQGDIIQLNGIAEERRYLLGYESGYPAANPSYQELIFGMLTGKATEFIHIGLDGLYPALHRGNSIALTLKPHALAPYGAKALVICVQYVQFTNNLSNILPE